MTNQENDINFDIVGKIVSLLQNLDKENQIHVLKTVNIWLKLNNYSVGQDQSLTSISDKTLLAQGTHEATSKFSDREEMSPKEFVLEKEPQTTIARIACLAYYLTHYRETPQFKTLDLSKLNTEAAQPKFSNAAQSVNDATKCGFLVPATKGQKQISAIGEQYVLALPDQEAAKGVLNRLRKPRRTKSIHKNNER